MQKKAIKSQKEKKNNVQRTKKSTGKQGLKWQ